MKPHTDEDRFRKEATGWTEIRQGYLPHQPKSTIRIRRKTTHDTKYVFTYKCKVNGTVVEVECPISKDDYRRLSAVAFAWCNKVRYHMPGGWEVDFFKDDHQTYFCMAEIELPEGDPPPDTLPPFIARNLMYSVPLGDTRFSSKNLTVKAKARKLLGELAA